MLIELTDEQKMAVDGALNNNVFILTGGPGTGKTTTCRQIIEQAEEREMKVGLCAPSGKAAKRMMEATDHEAFTIHKLLEAVPEDDRFVFMKNEQMPLLYDLIIVDETSMVSIDLMADLLRAVQRGTRVLFVGDQDQLPSVGPGTVLKDLLASQKFLHVELTKIHRNAGDIVKACHAIKRGKGFSPNFSVNVKEGRNMKHIELYNKNEIAETIVDYVSFRLPKAGFDSLWDVQVISPYKDDRELGCEDLNARIQAVLNPRPDKFKIKLGDKAIQTRNQKVKLFHGTVFFEGQQFSSSIGNSYVVNGDICQIIDVTKTNLIARFFDPERIVSLSKTDNHLLLAYAITCHRFQGSEAPVIVIPVHKSFRGFVNRPWIYTAISRAKTLCITVGEFGAIELAAKKEDTERRLTRLQQNLKRGKEYENEPMGDADIFGSI